MSVTPTQLRAFHESASAGSLSAAATVLGVTQSALTQQIRALEEEHGTALFLRHRRGVTLTPAGHALLGLTGPYFAMEGRIRALVSAQQSLERGHLRLAADSPYSLLRPIEAFHERHPRVTVEVEQGNMQDTLVRLLEQRADVAMLAEPPIDPRVESHLVGHMGLRVLLSHEHRLARRRSLNWSDLRGERWVHRESKSQTRTLFERAMRDAGLESVASVLTLGSREAVKEAVAVGLGIAYIATHEVGADARCVALPLRGLDTGASQSLSRLRSLAQRPLVAAFWGIATATLQEARTGHTS